MEKANAESQNKQKYRIPKDYNYEGARDLFNNAEVDEPDTIEVSIFFFRINI